MSDSQLQTPQTTKSASLIQIIIFCFIWSGLMLTEQISSNLLPYTIETFTVSAFIFGAIQFINPAFGFIAQPVVGILSDRIWTPVGRRAFFLIVSAPIVAICIIFVPYAQYLWQLVVLVILYQFFQDILWGSDHPLMADLFPPKQRVIVASALVITSEFAKYLFQKYAMVYWSVEQIYLYVPLVQVVFVAGGAFFLWEKKPDLSIKRDKLTVRKYIGDVFQNTMLRRFAYMNFCKMFYLTMIAGFVVRFATSSLNLSKEEFFNEWSITSLIALIFALPAGWFIEKYCSKQWALIAGYSIAVVGCILGFMANSVEDMFVVGIFIGVGVMVDNVTRKPFFTEYLPKEKIGQLTGALNVFLASGRAAAFVVGGAIIEYAFGNNFRYCWLIAGIMGLITIAIVFSLPDHRYQQRKLSVA